MAKWGEGDPRWLVQERSDGKNINGWHWEERDLTPWAKKRIGELIESAGIRADMGVLEGYARVTDLKSFQGEVSVSTRKGNKKLHLFDACLTLGWEGSLPTKSKAGEVFKGEIKVTEFANDTEVDEYGFSVSSDTSGEAQDALKAAVEKTRGQVFAMLEQFVKEFREQQ
eukprot:jgi/Mesvir1/24309/Mv10997-RA.1